MLFTIVYMQAFSLFKNTCYESVSLEKPLPIGNIFYMHTYLFREVQELRETTLETFEKDIGTLGLWNILSLNLVELEFLVWNWYRTIVSGPRNDCAERYKNGLYAFIS